jgi:hypothetical protein
MMRRHLSQVFTVAATLAAGLACAPAANASNGPVPGTTPVIQQAPCVDAAKLTGSDYFYNLCGVPDLDQVRVTAGQFVGLPGNGHNYCAPTSTTNLFAYLATKGFVNDPAVKDYTDPANFNEASQDIDQLGDLMGTTAASGTGGGGMLDGITQWLLMHGTPKVKISGSVDTLDIVTKSFTTGGYYSPDIGAMVQDAINGGLVVGVVGFYAPTTDPATSETHLMRVGGHLVSLVSAQGTLGTTASTLGVHDPATDWIDDDLQTPYSTDKWTLSAAAPDTYYSQDSGGALHPYTATLPQVNGSTSTLFDGYVTIEPKTVESVFHARLVFYAPAFGPVGPGPVHELGGGRVIREIAAPGPVADLALAPEGSQHPFLVKGSSMVYDADPLTGAVSKFAAGPAGARLLTFGGPEQTLFVAGAHQLVGLDRDGRTVARAKLSSPLDALAFDARRSELVGISAADGSVRVFSTALRQLSSTRLDLAGLGGGGRLSLAVASSGRLVVTRTGSNKVLSALPAVQHAARASSVGRLRARVRTLAVSANPKGLAVDDFGHMFVSVHGRLVELSPNGKRVAHSPYNGIPAGPSIDIARSFSNADPAISQQLDYLPPSRQGPARPDLVLVPTSGPQFTVLNQGFDAAGPFAVTITRPGLRGNVVDTYQFAGLAAGASVTQPYTCGPVTAPIAIDPTNQVAESDETNNNGITNACTPGG